MTIKILLADDHEILRNGLRILIEKQPNMKVIGETQNGYDTINLAKKILPDIIIMDITMPLLNGIEATYKILTECSANIKIIALSMHSDKKLIAGILEAGASGYLLKDCAFEELIGAIHSVMSNYTYLSPYIADIVLKNYVKKKSRYGKGTFQFPNLTNREQEILKFLAEGQSTKNIALNLNISSKTVETHRRNIMSKLDIENAAELIKYAIREGLISIKN